MPRKKKSPRSNIACHIPSASTGRVMSNKSYTVYAPVPVLVCQCVCACIWYVCVVWMFGSMYECMFVSECLCMIYSRCFLLLQILFC